MVVHWCGRLQGAGHLANDGAGQVRIAGEVEAKTKENGRNYGIR